MTYKEAIEEQKRMVKFRDKHYYGLSCSSHIERDEKSAKSCDTTYRCDMQ